MNTNESDQNYSFSFSCSKEANRICYEAQKLFSPELGVIFVDGVYLYIKKDHNLSKAIHAYINELLTNPKFQPTKRKALQIHCWAQQS